MGSLTKASGEETSYDFDIGGTFFRGADVETLSKFCRGTSSEPGRDDVNVLLFTDGSR
jgi:hypothetical protein